MGCVVRISPNAITQAAIAIVRFGHAAARGDDEPQAEAEDWQPGH